MGAVGEEEEAPKYPLLLYIADGLNIIGEGICRNYRKIRRKSSFARPLAK